MRSAEGLAEVRGQTGDELLTVDGAAVNLADVVEVNVGAVGYPRSQFETNYVIFDSEARMVTFRHIPFDFEDYCGQLKQVGVELPLWLADRMRNGDPSRTT